MFRARLLLLQIIFQAAEGRPGKAEDAPRSALLDKADAVLKGPEHLLLPLGRDILPGCPFLAVNRAGFHLLLLFFQVGRCGAQYPGGVSGGDGAVGQVPCHYAAGADNAVAADANVGQKNCACADKGVAANGYAADPGIIQRPFMLASCARMWTRGASVTLSPISISQQ